VVEFVTQEQKRGVTKKSVTIADQQLTQLTGQSWLTFSAACPQVPVGSRWVPERQGHRECQDRNLRAPSKLAARQPPRQWSAVPADRQGSFTELDDGRPLFWRVGHLLGSLLGRLSDRPSPLPDLPLIRPCRRV